MAIGDLTESETRDLISLFGFRETRKYEELIDHASCCFTTNDTTQLRFCRALRLEFSMDDPFFVKKGKTRRWAIGAWSKSLVPIYFMFVSAGRVFELDVPREKFAGVVLRILTSSWRSAVRSLDEIPASLLQAVRVVGANVKKMFPFCEHEIPSCVEYCVNARRLALFSEHMDRPLYADEISRHYFEQPRVKESWEEGWESDDDEGELDLDADDEDDSIEHGTDWEAYLGGGSFAFGGDLEWDEVAPGERRDELDASQENDLGSNLWFMSSSEKTFLLGSGLSRSGEESDSEMVKSNVSPYECACHVFVVASFLEARTGAPEWTARRIWFYMRDFLAGQTFERSSRSIDPDADGVPPASVVNACESYRSWLSGNDKPAGADLYLWNQFPTIKTAFRHFRKMLWARMRARNFRLAGRFERAAFLSAKEYAHLIRTKFHCTRPPNPAERRIPSSLHLADADDFVVVKFERAKATPLELHGTLAVIERKFGQGVLGSWRVIFDDDHSYVLMQGEKHTLLTQSIAPYLAMFGKKSGITRKASFPLYPFHLRGYFSGDRVRRALAVRFIVRCFSTGKMSSSTRNVAHNEDYDAHEILHCILDRFESTDRIWKALWIPLVDDRLSWSKGIKEQVNTFYSALVAFENVYSPHYISAEGLDVLTLAFGGAGYLTERDFFFVAQLVDWLRNSDQYGAAWVEIPMDCMEYHGVYYPPHLLLYDFCCSDAIPNSTAQQIFTSISVGVTVVGQQKCKRTVVSSIVFPRREFAGNRKRTRAITDASCELRIDAIAEKKLQDMRDAGMLDDDDEEDEDEEEGEDDATTKKTDGLKMDDGESGGALDFLMQALEEMFYTGADGLPSGRGMNGPRFDVNLSMDDILYSGIEFDMPVDMDPNGATVMASEAFPVFKSPLLEGSFLASGSNEEAGPLSGMHRDFLSCVITNPIFAISNFAVEADEEQEQEDDGAEEVEREAESSRHEEIADDEGTRTWNKFVARARLAKEAEAQRLLIEEENDRMRQATIEKRKAEYERGKEIEEEQREAKAKRKREHSDARRREHKELMKEVAENGIDLSLESRLMHEFEMNSGGFEI
jgi:hypothetical protein